MSIFNKNLISIQGGGGGGGNEGSGDNPGKPQCCGEPPTPSGPPDTYWLWPPYVKNIAPNGYGRRWFQRDALSENLEIPLSETQYTLIYIEKLKPEYGGVISSVWAERANFQIAPGNGFINDLIIFGTPKGWRARQFNYTRKVGGSDSVIGQASHIFKLDGNILLSNLCQIEKAGGYIFELMKFINSNNFKGDGSTKLLGDYTSIFNGSEFIYGSTPPTSSSHNLYIDTDKVYSIAPPSSGGSTTSSQPLPEPEGILIIKNYITKLSETTGDTGFIDYWNSLSCTNNLTTPAPVQQQPKDWSLLELFDALKDPWLAWDIGGRLVDDICAGIFLNGVPNFDFNKLNPNKGPTNLTGDQKTLIQYATYNYQFITARTYFINICTASKIYYYWKLQEDENYDVTGDLEDYPSLKNGIKASELVNILQDNSFQEFLKNTEDGLPLWLSFIKPCRAASDDAFTNFLGWFDSYDLTATLKLFNSNNSVSNNETKIINGVLCHRISWEDAGLTDSNINGDYLANLFGSNLIIGPTSINNLPQSNPNDPICLDLGACCFYTDEDEFIEPCEENILRGKCEAMGGIFHSNTSCADANCETPTTPPPTTPPPPTGACCYPTGIISGENDCAENITAEVCDSLGGTIHIGQNCSQISGVCFKLGACCYYDPSDSSVYYGCSENISKIYCQQDSGIHYLAQTCQTANCEPSTTTTTTIGPTTQPPVQRWAITDVSISSNGAYVTITKTTIQQCIKCVAPNCPVTEITACSIVGDTANIVADCGDGTSCLKAKLEKTESVLSDWEKTNVAETFKEYIYPEVCDQNTPGSYCNNGQCVLATKEQYDLAKTINPNIGNWSPEACNQ
jgi:hypothetical protein